jgi:hypothetical protein
MRISYWCIAVLLFSTLSILAEPSELPDYKARPLHILISKQVPGLVGRDYVGDFVQYTVQGQEFFGANFKIPFTDERLQSYFSRVKEASKGFTNPYAAILTLEATKKFGTYAEFSALFVPQRLDAEYEKLKLESSEMDHAEQRATDIQPMLAVEVEGVTDLFYYVNAPGLAQAINGTALVKKGNIYFPIFRPPTYPLLNDIVCAFAVQTRDHYLPIYIEEGK